MVSLMEKIALLALADALSDVLFKEEEPCKKTCKKEEKNCCHDDAESWKNCPYFISEDDFDLEDDPDFYDEPDFDSEPQLCVCECEPKEDENKIFGINIRVDEPRREDYETRWEFERDHAKFDALVDAAEACTWENKSNTAPLHKVNCIRRRVEDGPPLGINLVGESHWF